MDLVTCGTLFDFEIADPFTDVEMVLPAFAAAPGAFVPAPSGEVVTVAAEPAIVDEEIQVLPAEDKTDLVLYIAVGASVLVGGGLLIYSMTRGKK